MDLINLTAFCTSISSNAVSITAVANKLASALQRDDHNALQLNLMAASLGQLHRSMEQLEQALNAAPVISRQLHDQLFNSLSACAGRMNDVHTDVMYLHPSDLSSLNGSFLTAYAGFTMIHAQTFAFLTNVLSQHEQAKQEQSLDSTAVRDLIKQAETTSQLIDNLKILQPNADSMKSTPLSEKRQPPVTSNNDAPPPYMSSAPSPTSPAVAQSPERPKGSSFFRALTSALRSKPDPLVSALCQAIVQGNEQQISGLISQGANINGSNEDGRTPLRCAIKSDQAGAARLLLSAGVNTSSKGWSELPPLFQAASAGSLKVAQVLLEFGADVHSKAVSGQSHLVDVVNKGNATGVGFLLASGAAADTKDITGQQIIVMAAKKGSVELVRVLIDNGAEINATDIIGNTVLVTAIEKGDMNMLELLLDKGADTEARTNLGMTVLGYAIEKRKFDIAKRLLVGGANPGTTIHSQPIIIKILRDGLLKTGDKMEVIRLLLDNGVDPDTADAIWGLPAICHAVELSKAPVVEEMLRRGAKTKVRMLAGQTLLTYSIDVNRRKHIKALIDYGVDVNEVDGLNRTPLMLSLLRLDYNLAKMFVDHGADPTAKANEEAVKFIKAIKRNDFLELFRTAGSEGSAASETARPERTVPNVPDYTAEMPASETFPSEVPGSEMFASEVPASEVPPPSYELAAGKR
ncbi:hypothetical protein FAVG1_02579 [Fusarium avenaceum]|nr:hypothetical protein FAVG1_02579 [Fusarium avenaceum]